MGADTVLRDNEEEPWHNFRRAEQGDGRITCSGRQKKGRSTKPYKPELFRAFQGNSWMVLPPELGHLSKGSVVRKLADDQWESLCLEVVENLPGYDSLAYQPRAHQRNNYLSRVPSL